MTGNPVVSSSSFYTSCEEPDYSSLAYSNAGTNNVPTSSGARTPPPHMQLVATSPELDAENEVEEPMPRQRSRSHSAPCVLYEQVALQLRGISDDFNREYSHHSRDEDTRAVQRPSQRSPRRRSLPDVHRHEPRSPNWLHRMIQSFRSESNTPARSHNSSISRVPEEDMDIDDELGQET